MRTEETFSLLRTSQQIRVALLADGERIGALLNERYPPPVIEGESTFDHRRQMQHLLHELDDATTAMVAAEDDYVGQQVLISRLLEERNEEARIQRGKLVSVRKVLEGVFGAKSSYEMAFVSGTTPRRADRLVEQLVQSLTLLRQPTVEPPEAQLEALDVDLGAVADEIEASKDALKDKVDAVAAARKRVEGKLLAKRRAIDELRRTILWAGRSAEGLFHRASESELAARIRSSTRRPLRPSELPDQGSPEGETSQETAPEPVDSARTAEEAPATPGAASPEAEGSSSKTLSDLPPTSIPV